MAIVNGTIVETGQAITVDLPTARPPELPAATEIADDDLFTIYDSEANKTKKVSTIQLIAKFNGTPIESPPVLSGADMEITIPAELIGQKRIDIPALAGYNYSLERIGPSSSSRYPTAWFNNLSTGGFELTRDFDVFYDGDIWIAHIFELEGGSSTIPGGSTGGSGLIKGIRTVSSNITVFDDDMGKLISVQGGTEKLVLTLDDVENITENSTVEFITMINNNFQTTIQTTSGQFIYINGSGYLKVYLGKGESLKLARGSDGWYAMGTVIGYLLVGKPYGGYKQGLNDVVANGQLLKRDEWPRLWEEVQTFGTSLISDAEWLSGTLVNGSPARRGCFSTGDGSTDFRVCDLRGATKRFLDLGRGFDVNPREYNMAGSYQADAVGRFDKSTEGYNRLLQQDGHGTIVDADDNSGQPNLFSSGLISAFGSPENTVKSFGFIPLIPT